MQPARHPTGLTAAHLLPWDGTYVSVSATGEVVFRACVVCARPLSKPEADGLGPECKRRTKPDDVAVMRAAARQIDRDRFRDELADMRRRQMLRENIATASYGVDADQRWAVFQAAISRKLSP